MKFLFHYSVSNLCYTEKTVPLAHWLTIHKKFHIHIMKSLKLFSSCIEGCTP